MAGKFLYEAKQRICAVRGCKRLTYRNKSGYFNNRCDMHTRRFWKRKGEVGGPAPEKALNGLGYFTKRGYVVISVKGKKKYRHRLIWEQTYGPIPKGMVVHHKDGDKTHDTIDNFELLPDQLHKRRHAGERWASSA